MNTSHYGATVVYLPVTQFSLLFESTASSTTWLVFARCKKDVNFAVGYRLFCRFINFPRHFAFGAQKLSCSLVIVELLETTVFEVFTAASAAQHAYLSAYISAQIFCSVSIVKFCRSYNSDFPPHFLCPIVYGTTVLIGICFGKWFRKSWQISKTAAHWQLSIVIFFSDSLLS